MQAKQQPSEQPEFNRLDSVEELATERFGSAEGLAIVQKNTLDLSKFYAERYGLDATNPEVTLTATALAFARHKEFTLLRELEHDLFERVTTSTAAVTYGQVLFNTTRTGAYRDVYRELDRLHNRAAVYLKELRELAKEQTYLEDEC